MTQVFPPSSASEHSATAQRLTSAGVCWTTTVNAGTTPGNPERELRYQLTRLQNELRDHGSDVPIDAHGFLGQLMKALGKPYRGELAFQEAVLNVLRMLFNPKGTFRLAQSYMMSFVEDYDRTLLAPSPRSMCDIALVNEPAHCVAAVIEAKCDEAMYSDTLHGRLSAGKHALSDVKSLGPAVQTIAYIGAAVLPSMRRHQYYGLITGAVINCAKLSGNPPAHAALLLELRPPESCFSPWVVNVTQAVPYGETTSGARAAAIVLQVLADGLMRLHAANRPNPPFSKPMPLLGPLAGTTLFASPMCLVGQPCSIRYGELVRVCRPVDVVIGALKKLMGQGSVVFGELQRIEENDLIKLASGMSVVRWTNSLGGFCHMWGTIQNAQLRIQLANAGWRYLVGQTAQWFSRLVNALRVLLEFFHLYTVLTYVLSPLVWSLSFICRFLSTRHNTRQSLLGVWRDEVSSSAGLQRACETIGRVLVCAGISTINSGIFMVMKDVSQQSALTMEHVADWPNFFKQIVEDFLLPLAENGIVYFDLRPGGSNLRVTNVPPVSTSDPPVVQYLPLDLDSLTVLSSEVLNRRNRLFSEIDGGKGSDGFAVQTFAAQTNSTSDGRGRYGIGVVFAPSVFSRTLGVPLLVRQMLTDVQRTFPNQLGGLTDNLFFLEDEGKSKGKEWKREESVLEPIKRARIQKFGSDNVATRPPLPAWVEHGRPRYIQLSTAVPVHTCLAKRGKLVKEATTTDNLSTGGIQAEVLLT